MGLSAQRLSSFLKSLPPKPKVVSAQTEAAVNIQIKWKQCKTVSYMDYAHRVSNAVVINSVVHCTQDGQNIHGYDTSTNNWFQLPNCGRYYASIALVDNLLTVIGGEQNNKTLNTLLSLSARGAKAEQWNEIIPPMPTACYYTCALSSEAALIMIGGKQTLSKPLNTVQVMSIKTKKWKLAASLPKAIYSATATICGDDIYVLGANVDGNRSKYVFTCSLSALLQSSVVSSNVQRKIADLPVTRSTCVTFQKRLLAIGGMDSRNDDSKAVYVYDPATNTWSAISHMTSPHCGCSAAVLPGNKLIVVAGSSNSIEVGTLVV